VEWSSGHGRAALYTGARRTGPAGGMLTRGATPGDGQHVGPAMAWRRVQVLRIGPVAPPSLPPDQSPHSRTEWLSSRLESCDGSGPYTWCSRSGWSAPVSIGMAEWCPGSSNRAATAAMRSAR
jgi:hypothetical protein